jgi:hypothetical protein
MVGGFNHNYRYKGEVYHIQTEDGGRRSPNIVSLLYRGGTILASKKTSYADIAKVDNLEQVVEELMKEQHKEMLRNLKVGEFDVVIESFEAGSKGAKPAPFEPDMENGEAPTVETTAPVPEPGEAFPSHPAEEKPEPNPQEKLKPGPSVVETSLDEIILSYLMDEDK